MRFKKLCDSPTYVTQMSLPYIVAESVPESYFEII